MLEVWEFQGEFMIRPACIFLAILAALFNSAESAAWALPASGAGEAARASVKLEAKPQPIDLDLSRTAVIVVDMQNDFVSKGGMFDHKGLEISMNQAAVAPTAKVLSAAREAGIRIIYLKMGFKPDLSDLGAPDSVNRERHMFLNVGEAMKAPDGSEGRFLVRDTWNTEIVSELRPQKGDIVLYKTRFSGFYDTSLDANLKKLRAKYLIFTGVTTSICVESTVRDAMFRDYLPIVLEDCVAEPIGYDLERSNHEASLLAIQTLFGWVSTSDSFTRAVGARLHPTVHEP